MNVLVDRQQVLQRHHPCGTNAIAGNVDLLDALVVVQSIKQCLSSGISNVVVSCRKRRVSDVISQNALAKDLGRRPLFQDEWPQPSLTQLRQHHRVDCYGISAQSEA